MARFISTTIAANQSVSADNVAVKSVLLVAAGATASCAIRKVGSADEIRLTCVANTSQQFLIPGGHAQVAPIVGAVEADLTGAGAFLRIDY